MENKFIVARIDPFLLEQEIRVYENRECIREVSCNIKEFCTKVYQLCEEYDIKDVNFKGGKFIAMKFQKDFLNNKFGKRDISINILD